MRTEKEDIQKIVALNSKKNPPKIAKTAVVHRTELQGRRINQIEMSNMVAREIQQAKARQTGLVDTELVTEVRAPVVEEHSKSVKATEDNIQIPPKLYQPISMAEKTPNRSNAIPKISSLPIQIEGKRELIEASLVHDPEVIDYEQFEESLPNDNSGHEINVDAGDVGDVNVLSTDLDEGDRQVGDGYTGDLPVDVFTAIPQAESVEAVDVQFPQTTPLEAPENSPDISETATFQVIEKEFSHYLESLVPKQIEATKNVIEELKDILKERQQTLGETSSEEIETVDQRIEELCVLLFESLGIKCDEENIRQFMQSITTQESLLSIGIEPNEFSPHKLNYLGTHEYKLLGNISWLGNLAQLIKQKMRPHIILGRYALHEVQCNF